MKKAMNFLLVCLSLMLFGCGILDKEALEEAAGDLLKGEEVSGEVSQAEIDDLFAGEAIVNGNLSLYYEIDIYDEKVFRLKDRTDANNILETYFATRAILGKRGPSRLDLENDPADLEGTWIAYKQTQQATTNDAKDFLVKTDDDDNNFELIVLYTDGKLVWDTRLNGSPVFYTEEEAETLIDNITSDVAALIEAEKKACEDRTDFTQEQIDLCKETVDKCSPANYDQNRAFCAVADYNPCDRPDLDSAEVAACEVQVERCGPGGEDAGKDICNDFFDPCGDPNFTAEQRATCRFVFENCGPGGELEGQAECNEIFNPCKGLTGDDLALCQDIESKCTPENFEANKEFCAEALHPCNLPGLTNEQKEECHADFEAHDCGNPANFHKPECQVEFDPCAGLTGSEMEECHMIDSICGPHNMDITADELAFCAEKLNPCDDPGLTVRQRAECEVHWARCGPGGTEEGTPACFEIHDPCEGLMDTPEDSALTECREIEKRCSPENAGKEENREFCGEIFDPCNLPGLTNEQKEECRANFANHECEKPENFDKPECHVVFDPCHGLEGQELEDCRVIDKRCGPENIAPTPEDFAFCADVLNPCKDPSLTAHQRAACEEHWARCGPGGTEEGTPACFEIHDPCEGLVDVPADTANGLEADSALTECREIEMRCSPENAGKPENADFCAELLDPCNLPGLTNEQKEECRANFANHECEKPENFDKPECHVIFDPCEGLEGQELEDCRVIDERCGPTNIAPTPEDYEFCAEVLSPCNDPLLTVTEKLECEEHWARCGPGGTEEGSPQCFEAHDPCADPFLSPEEQAQCREEKDKCKPENYDANKEFCDGLLDPCNIPGITQEQRDQCRFCQDPANIDLPECGGGEFDPCAGLEGEEETMCREVEARCGINFTPADEQFCKDALSPCNDPLLTEEERVQCEDHFFNCGPGGPLEGTPECFEGFDPCDAEPDPQQCRIDRDRCSPENFEANREFCEQTFDPCEGLVDTEMDSSLTECRMWQENCGPQVVDPDPSCFEVERDPCSGESPQEQALCDIIIQCMDEANKDDPFCADESDIDPCDPNNGSDIGTELCDFVMSTCHNPFPAAEDEKFCHDYFPRDESGGGAPRPFLGPAANLHRIISDLFIGHNLRIFTPEMVSITYYTRQSIEDMMNSPDEVDPVGKMSEVKFMDFKDAMMNPEFIDITLGDGKVYRLMEAMLPDPNDPTDEGDGPGNVPGGPSIIDGGLGLIENSAWELFGGPGGGKLVTKIKK